MNCHNFQHQATNPIDHEFVELIESHQSAMKGGDFQAADSLGYQVLNRAVEAMVHNAEQGEVDEDFLWRVEAIECEEHRDWDGALAAYNRVVQIAQQESSAFGTWRAHDNFASLHYLMGELEQALEEQRLATTAAREADSSVSLRIALISEAELLLRLDQAPQAALRVREGLAIPNNTDLIDELGIAKLHVLEAACEAATGHVDEARQLLQLTYPDLARAEQMPGAAGYHSALCYWWHVSANCCEIENDIRGEVYARRRALDVARHIDEIPHVAGVYSKAAVASALDRLARALWNDSHHDEARRIRREALEIRAALKLPAAIHRRK